MAVNVRTRFGLWTGAEERMAEVIRLLEEQVEAVSEVYLVHRGTGSLPEPLARLATPIQPQWHSGRDHLVVTAVLEVGQEDTPRGVLWRHVHQARPPKVAGAC